MVHLLINVLGLLLIALTVGWFFFSKSLPATVLTHNNVLSIRVKDGIYEPSRFKAPARTPLILRFFRQDPTTCAEVVVFPTLKRSYFLPLNKMIEIKLDPQPPGELEFSCQMGMYRGSIVLD